MYESDNQILSVIRQAELLSIQRIRVYRKPKELSQRDLENIQIMHRIDEIYTDHPFYGYRRIPVVLSSEYEIGKNKVLSLMQKMGIYAIYPRRT